MDLVVTWQRQWDIQTNGRWTHGLLPKVKLNRGKELLHDRPLRQADCRLNRLLSGCTLLRTHPLRKQLDRKAGIPYSIMCECGQAPQDIEHYLLECNLMNQEREQLVQTLMELILKNNLKYQKVSVDLLLGDLEDVPKSVSIEVRRAVLCYLTDTCSKIKI